MSEYFDHLSDQDCPELEHQTNQQLQSGSSDSSDYKLKLITKLVINNLKLRHKNKSLQRKMKGLRTNLTERWTSTSANVSRENIYQHQPQVSWSD